MDNLLDIVLVEDNPHDAELTLDALEKYNLAGRVKVLRDGAEALDYFCSGETADRGIGAKPRVVILDLKLPKVSGLEVLKKIRSDERTRLIPVVVLTSSAQEKDRLESYRLGANSYIVKPVEFENFGVAISRIGLYWAILNRPAL